VLVRVGPVAEDELIIVLRERQRLRHLLVRERPIPVLVVEIARPVLQENPQRLLLRLADQRRVDVPSPDVGETPDVAQHLAERVRALPGHGKGADPPRTRPADRPLLGIIGQLVLLPDLGQDLLQKEAGVLVAQRVILETPVVRPPAVLQFLSKGVTLLLLASLVYDPS